MKRIALFVAVLLCVTPVKAYSQQKIIETIQIIPNPVILLKAEVHQTRDWETNCSDSTISLDYEDAQRMLKIAFAEAGNQGIEGQLRVMQVIWNRVNSPDYPDTIEGVISQEHQFQSYRNGSYQSAEPTEETHEALALFEANKNHDSNIIAFETSTNGRSLERYFSFLYTFKDHDFFGEKKKSP